MKFVRSHLILGIIIVVGFSIYGQQVTDTLRAERVSLYNEFAHFFDEEIKQQGVKGDWIFRLNEILGLHKFDFNNDGLIDTFMEFDAISIEGEAIIYQYAVLFQNKGNKYYKFIDFIESNNSHFLKFEDGHFIFLQNNASSSSNSGPIYFLKDSKFILNK